MFKQLHRGMSRGIVLVLATGLLGGCATLVPKSSQLPAQKAVTAAYERLYLTPNYAFNGQVRLDELEITTPAAKDDIEKQPSAKTEEDDFAVGSAAYNGMIEDLIKSTSQRYRFNYSGVVDLQHKQLELIPEFRYESRNMAGYVRMPMLLDGNEQALYADFSAFSPWLISTANEGKYSRIHKPGKPGDVMDPLVLLEMLRDFSLSLPQLGDVNQFSELDITATDRTLGTVRKIQFSTPLNPYAAKIALFMASNKERFGQQFVQGPQFDKSKLPALVEVAAVKSRILQDPAAYEQVLSSLEKISETDSQLIQTILLDKHGRVLQSNWQVYFVGKDGKKGKLKFRLNSQLNYSQFGNAKISYQPKPGNWLDIKESMNNTLFGSLFSKGLLGLADKGSEKSSKKATLDSEETVKAEK